MLVFVDPDDSQSASIIAMQHDRLNLPVGLLGQLVKLKPWNYPQVFVWIATARLQTGGPPNCNGALSGGVLGAWSKIAKIESTPAPLRRRLSRQGRRPSRP